MNENLCQITRHGDLSKVFDKVPKTAPHSELFPNSDYPEGHMVFQSSSVEGKNHPVFEKIGVRLIKSPKDALILEFWLFTKNPVNPNTINSEIWDQIMKNEDDNSPYIKGGRSIFKLLPIPARQEGLILRLISNRDSYSEEMIPTVQEVLPALIQDLYTTSEAETRERLTIHFSERGINIIFLGRDPDS